MKCSVFLVLCFLGFCLHAQEQAVASVSYSGQTVYKAGYTGNLFWNNGLLFGAEYLWKDKFKVKQGRRKQQIITQHLIINGQAGFTNNFATETDAGFFTHFGLIWRRANAKGRQLHVELNPLGYYRSFLPETYEVRGNDVEQVFLPGRSYYAPSLSLGVGKQRDTNKLAGRYFNINMMLRTPFNAGVSPFVSVQYGYRFNFKKRN